MAHIHPLLSAASVRIDVEGTVAIDGLSFKTAGERVLVLGAARALFEAAAGLRETRRGVLAVEGIAPRAALFDGRTACAPLDPPLPAGWTVERYVTWSVRLAGHGRKEREGLVARALDALALGSSASSKLGRAGPSLRRAAVLAAALATAAPVLIIEDPLMGLPDDAARSVARLLSRALGERRSIIFASRIPLESPIALTSDEAIVVDHSNVAAQGAPAELAAAEGSLALRVAGDVSAFATAIEQHGARAFVARGALLPRHVRVELGPALRARELFRIATEVRAIVLELRPISRAFA